MWEPEKSRRGQKKEKGECLHPVQSKSQRFFFPIKMTATIWTQNKGQTLEFIIIIIIITWVFHHFPLTPKHRSLQDRWEVSHPLSLVQISRSRSFILHSLNNSRSAFVRVKWCKWCFLKRACREAHSRWRRGKPWWRHSVVSCVCCFFFIFLFWSLVSPSSGSSRPPLMWFTRVSLAAHSLIVLSCGYY